MKIFCFVIHWTYCITKMSNQRNFPNFFFLLLVIACVLTYFLLGAQLLNNCNTSVMKVILQLAESGSFFGQVDLFKVRGKFALSDAYEDHFMLPKGKILVVTHTRVILLQVCIHDWKQWIKPIFLSQLTHQSLSLSATIQYYCSEKVQPCKGSMFNNVGYSVGWSWYYGTDSWQKRQAKSSPITAHFIFAI